MATTEFSVLQRGTRVTIQRGSMAIDPALVGREGMVVDASQYHPHRYGVVLDGESEMRTFAADELRPGSENPRLEGDDRAAAKKRLARP